jgi:hypothetical protein
MPLLYSSLRIMRQGMVPKPVLDQLREYFYANVAQNRFLTGELRKLLQLLKAHHITFSKSSRSVSGGGSVCASKNPLLCLPADDLNGRGLGTSALPDALFPLYFLLRPMRLYVGRPIRLYLLRRLLPCIPQPVQAIGAFGKRLVKRR